MIPIVYYAHSMLIYGSREEAKELEMLKIHFRNHLIFNPNRPSIQHAKNPMKACFDAVKDECVIDIAFGTDALGCVRPGVYAEVRLAQKLGKPIHRILQYEIILFPGAFRRATRKKPVLWRAV